MPTLIQLNYIKENNTYIYKGLVMLLQGLCSHANETEYETVEKAFLISQEQHTPTFESFCRLVDDIYIFMT